MEGGRRTVASPGALLSPHPSLGEGRICISPQSDAPRLASAPPMQLLEAHRKTMDPPQPRCVPPISRTPKCYFEIYLADKGLAAI